MAALAAVDADKSVVQPMCEEFKRRREIVYKLLSAIPNLKCNMPTGAFYFFPDISAYFGKSFNGNKINNSADLCMFLLNEVHVAAVSGDAFGDDNCFRISYACSEKDIIEAVSRIKKGLDLLS
jgi:aspartate aminotransferase